MPTAPAVDRVAKSLKLECYEVPTGWKFFGNLMDKDLICLCGEESFGTGSNHIREKDGLWTVLCWLSILVEKADENGETSVQKVVEEHWKEFGRNYFTRYDYENCLVKNCDIMMGNLRSSVERQVQIGREYKVKEFLKIEDESLHDYYNAEKVYKVVKMDEYEYLDPVDKSLTKNQGIRIIFDDGSRVIVRLSGTGSSGATIRLYVDSYVSDKDDFTKPTEVALKGLIDIATTLTGVKIAAQRCMPTVIT